MKKLLRLFHTIRYLKCKQICYRIFYRLKPVRLSSPQKLNGTREWKEHWDSPRWQNTILDANGKFCFLNECGSVESSKDWNCESKSKLWLYNLHYLDVLDTRDGEERLLQTNEMIEDWIAHNPEPEGNGWEPYTLSLRLVNLVKWQMRQNYSGSLLIDSIGQQASSLSQQIEYHIMANHLFANGKALVFAGAALSNGDEILKKGLDILDVEIPEQFLKDGGHFELSPMYHAILLWDMCDLLNLAKKSGITCLKTRDAEWSKVIQDGLTWLATMCHSDGDIAFFNDSTFGIAPKLSDLSDYALTLGIKRKDSKRSNLTATYLKESGYIAVESDSSKCILDVGKIGAKYQPGHAHADILSFELSLFGQRVFVNSGISQYGAEPERYYQRSTKAHSTVVVDGKNSSEIWGGFRVGRRAYPDKLQVEHGRDNILVSCEHNGFRSFLKSANHLRKWEIGCYKCLILDQISGDYLQAEARYYLHPDIEILQLTDDEVKLKLPDSQIVKVCFENQARLWIDKTFFYPGFGLKQANNCLVVSFIGKNLITKIDWQT